MKKIIISVTSSVILLYIIYISIILTMNYEGVYKKFHKQIADIGYDAKTTSIEVIRFPIPRVDLGDISIPNVLYAKKLEIQFSLLSILRLNPTIKNIELRDVRIMVPKNGLDLAGHEGSMVNTLRVIPKLPALVAHDVSLIDKNTKIIDSHIDSIIIDPKSGENQLIFNWNKEDITNISYQNINNGIKLHIHSIGSAHTVDIDEIYQSGKLQSGSIKYTINNLQKFVASKYQDVDLLITKIQSPESAELSCKIKVNDDRIRISDISFNSKSISMMGNMDVYRSQTPDLIDLTFDFIDLKTLLAAPNMDFVNESKAKEKLGLDNVVRRINLKAKKVILADAELQDAVFNAFIDKKKLNIEKLSANIVGGGEFNVSGAVTQNQYRSLFEGNFDIKHKDANILLSKLGYDDLTTKKPTNFVLTSNVRATPIDYQLDNIFMKIGNFSLDGGAAIKFIGQSPRINLTLGISSVDLMETEYPALSKLIGYLKSLGQDTHSKDYLKKYIPLREIDYLGNFDLSFTDLYVGDEQIDKLRIISEVTAGKIILNSIYYQDEQNYISGAGYIAAAGIKPEIGLKVSEGMLETSSFTIGHILKFFQSLQTDYDLNKLNINSEIAVQSIKQNGKIFKDLTFNAKNDGILWNISSLGGSYSSGKFSSSGSLRMDSMNLNLAYAYNDFNLKEISDILPLQLFGIEDGWMSINGMISTSGVNIDQIFYNLYSKSSFITKDMKWKNFDLDGFIALADDMKYPSSKLDNDVIRYMSSGNTKVRTLAGDMEVNHGLFKFSDVKFDTKRSNNTSAAEYNIYNNKLSINTILSFTPPALNAYSNSQPIAFNMKVTNDIINPQKSFELTNFKKFLDTRIVLPGFYQGSTPPASQLK